MVNRKQNVFHYENHDDDDEEEFHIDTYLSNVVARQQPIQIQRHKINTTASTSTPQRNFIPNEDWLRIPEDVRKKLTSSNEKSNTNTSVSTVNFDIEDLQDNEKETTDLVPYVHDHDDSNILSYLSNQTTDVPDVSINTIDTTRSPNNRTSTQDSITLNGIKYRKVNIINIMYQVNNTHKAGHGYALMDCGANGGVLGSNVRILHHTSRHITLTGIDNHQLPNLNICTAAAYTTTNKGPAIIIMNQYAFLGHGKIIHASSQLEAFGVQVDERSKLVTNGKQQISTPDGYTIPLDIIQGLAYMKIRPPTDDELTSLPHIIFTSDDDWDPTIIDNITTDDVSYITDTDNGYTDQFNELGEYQQSLLTEVSIFLPSQLETSLQYNIKTTKVPVDFESYRPKFGWAPTHVIKHTFDNTTQHIRSLHLYDDMRKIFKSRFPTDTVYSDTPAIDDG
jgi:hypothetical protein